MRSTEGPDFKKVMPNRATVMYAWDNKSFLLKKNHKQEIYK